MVGDRSQQSYLPPQQEQNQQQQQHHHPYQHQQNQHQQPPHHQQQHPFGTGPYQQHQSFYASQQQQPQRQQSTPRPAQQLQLATARATNRQSSASSSSSPTPTASSAPLDVAITHTPTSDQGTPVSTSDMAAVCIQQPIAQPAERPRKRTRREASPSGGQDKRARGRPRIDTKDQSATERRRTQIRLAQRAYRSRKETTLTTLENENDHFRNVSAEMVDVFMQVVADANRPNQDPSRLESATQHFMSLASRFQDGARTNTTQPKEGRGRGRKRAAGATATVKEEEDEEDRSGSLSSSDGGRDDSPDTQPPEQRRGLGSTPPSASTAPVPMPLAVSASISPRQFVAASPPMTTATLATTASVVTPTSAFSASSIMAPAHESMAHSWGGYHQPAESYMRHSVASVSAPQPTASPTTVTPSGSSWPAGPGLVSFPETTYEVIAMPTVANSSIPLAMTFAGNSPPLHPMSRDEELDSPQKRSRDQGQSQSHSQHQFQHQPGAEAYHYDQILATAGMAYPVPIARDSGFWPQMPTSLGGYAYKETTFGRRLHRTAVELGLQLVQMMNPPPHLYAAVFGFCLLFETRESIESRLMICLEKGTDMSLDNYRVPFVNLGGIGTHFPAHSAGGGKESDFSATGQPDRGMPWGNVSATQPYRPAHHTGFSTGPFASKIEDVRDSRIGEGNRVLHPGFMGDFFDPEDVELYLRHKGIVIPQGAECVEVEIDAATFASLDGAAASIGSSKWQGNMPRVVDMYNQAINGSLYTAPPPEPYIPRAMVSPPGKKKVTINVDLFTYEVAFRCICFGRSPGVRPRDVNLAFWRAVTIKDL